MKNSVMKFHKLILLILLTVITAGGVIAVAEDNDSNTGNNEGVLSANNDSNTGNNEAVLSTNNDSNTGSKEVLSTLGQRMQKRISVDFRDTPIDDVLRIMAEQSGVDIIKSPKVIGVVTATLTNVPLEEALSNILASQGYGYVASNNMIRILPIEELSETSDRLVNRIYRITYANVSEVEAALKKFISPRGSLSSNPGTSNIIVTDSESRIKAIDDFIEEIDRVVSQILVEARIYDVTTTENFDIGLDWHVGKNVPITDIGRVKTLTRTVTDVGETDTTGTITRTVTDTVDTVDPTNTGTVTETVDESTSGSAAGRIGDTTTSKDVVTDTTAHTWLNKTSYSKSNPFIGGGFAPLVDGGTIRFGVLNDVVDIELALTMLQKQVGAKLLANPRILVLDNQKASIKIVSEIPYQEVTETSGGGSIGTTAFREVGVDLTVTPHITREGMVRLQLKPKFSVQNGTVKVGTLTNQFPQPVVDRREADTTLLIENGQTVVLGGLRKKSTTKQVNKMPMFGDLPLVGAAFRSESEDTVTSELVVFITPRIIEKPVLTEMDKRQLDVTDFNVSLPSFTRAEGPEAKN